MRKFQPLADHCESLGLVLERGSSEPGHHYVLFFNAPDGAKEWHCRNLSEVNDTAIPEAVEMRRQYFPEGGAA